MALPKKHGVIALFEYLDDLCLAADKIKESEEHGPSKFKDYEILSPTSYHEIIEREEEKLGVSQVRWFTCVGALTGVVTGFSMPLLMDYNWPIVVGGKTAGIYSVIAYFVFGFELMVLFGAIATIIGMLVMGRLPNPRAQIYDKRTTDDRFAIFVPNTEIDGEQAALLKKCGAQEIYSL